MTATKANRYHPFPILDARPGPTNPDCTGRPCICEGRPCHVVPNDKPFGPCTCELNKLGLTKLAEPRLWHGIDPWSDEAEHTWGDRVAAWWAIATGEIAIPAPFSLADYRFSLDEPDNRDWRRATVVLQDLEAEHEDRHFFWNHPFCGECRGNGFHARASLHRWMALHPGKAVPAAELDVPAPPREAEAARKTFLTMADLVDLPPARMHIGEVLPYASHGIVSGRDGTYKTFLCIDFMLHLASYGDWQGRDTHGGRVLYLAGEGVHQFGKRFAAWQAANEWTLDEDEQANVVVRNGTVDLHSGAAEYAQLLAFVKEWQPLLIVVDTLQRSSGGADQNSAADMAVITERMAQLRAASQEGCSTIMVAHTDKGDNDTRGSSSIEDDADFVLHCERKGTQGLVVEVAKMKDGPSKQKIELGVQEVAGSLAIVSKAALPAPPPEAETPEQEAQRFVLGVLRYRGRTVDPITEVQVLAQVNEDRGEAEKLTRQRCARALARLVEAGKVEQIGEGGRGTKYRIHRDHVSTGDKRTAKGDI